MMIPMFTNRSFLLKLTTIVTALFATPCLQASAQDLLVSPLRIVFEDNKKSQEINLANVGKDTASYMISILDYRMKEDGTFEQVDTPDAGQNFAGPFLRYFPRKVSLAPNEAQVVKVQLIKTNELQPGEYRSHMYFRSVPDEKPLGENDEKKDTGITIQLKPIFGITIPIIVRIGEYNATAAINKAFWYKGDGDKNMLHLEFARTGSMSVYGEVKVEHVSPAGKTTTVKQIKGVGIYTPLPIRTMNVELDGDKGVDYHSGKLHIAYTIQAGKTEQIIEAETALK